jgi:hypothetical protein
MWHVRTSWFGTAPVQLNPSLPPSLFLETTPTMSKTILSLVAAALFCVAGSAKAEGISENTLADMGLSGMSVMSDADAMSVRGHGFSGHGKMGKGCKSCGPRGTKSPYSRAFGSSFANIETKDGDAHTENGYFSEGPYGASGENYSEAGSSVTTIETVDIDGVVKTITNTCNTLVFAGGHSSAMSF